MLKMLIVVGGVAAAGCQAERRSQIAGADAAAATPHRDTSLVWALVASDRIDDPRVLKPAQGSLDGTTLPATLAGIWSMNTTDHPLTRGPLALSLANATWDAATLTAKFTVRGANAYVLANSYDDSVTGHKLVKTGDPVIDDDQQSYWLKFSADFKHAVLTYMALQNGQMKRSSIGGLYTMDLDPQNDGHWLRVSYEGGYWKGDSYLDGTRQSDYDLIRIVKADGTREAAFQTYVANAPRQVVVAVSKDSDLGRGVIGPDLQPRRQDEGGSP